MNFLFIILMTSISNLTGIQKTPVQWEQSPWHIREKYLDLHYNYRNFTMLPTANEIANDSLVLEQRNLNVDSILRFIKVINETTCKW